MRQGEHVKFNEEVTKQVIDRVKATYIPANELLALYHTSYLPIMTDCLASIADSLEILTKDLEEKEKESIFDKIDKIDEIITDALDKSTDQKESQTLRWVLDKISEVVDE